MSKIDLHFHTASHKGGESRNYDLRILSNYVKKANIGLLAITNHDYFDNDNFEEFTSYLNSSSTIVYRGVEVDVLYNNNQRHAIVIFDDDFNAEEINKISDKFKNIEFIEILNFIVEEKLEDRILLYPHSSKKSKGFELTEMKNINSLNNRTYKDIVIVWDLSLVPDQYVEPTNEYFNLPSTDAHEYEDYSKKAEGLFNLVNKPKSFSDFISLIKEKNLYMERVTTYQNKLGDLKVIVKEGDNSGKDLGSIEIKRGLNVIIGRRGTGKTELLDQINNFAIENKIKVEDITSKDETEFDEVQKELFEEHCSELKKEISKLNIDLNDENYIPFDKDGIKNFFKLKIDERENQAKNNFIKMAKIILSETTVEIEEKDTEISILIELVNKANEFKSKVKEYSGNVDEIKDFDFNQIDELISVSNKEILRIKKKDVLPARLAAKMHNHIISKFGQFNKVALNAHDEIGISKYWNTTWKKNFLIANKRLEKMNKIKNIKGKKHSFDSLPDNERIAFNTNISTSLEISSSAEFKCAINIFGVSENFTNSKKYEESNKRFLKPFYYDGSLDEETISKIVCPTKTLMFKYNYDLSGEVKSPSSGQKHLIVLDRKLFSNKKLYLSDIILIDEIERGLENPYITSNLNSKIDELISKNKTVFVSTHNANVAILHETSKYYLTDGIVNHKIYMSNDDDGFKCITDESDVKNWSDVVIEILEGSKEAMEMRREKYGI